MRALTTASMDTPGPFENVAKEGFFNVTLPDPSMTPAEVSDGDRRFAQWARMFVGGSRVVSGERKGALCWRSLFRAGEAPQAKPGEKAAEAPAKHQAVTRLIGRIVTEPHAETQEVLRSQRAAVWTAFLKAWQRSLPKARLPELFWRIEFVWGALAFVLCNPRKIELETHGACNPAKTDEVLAGMIHFFSPGFHALARGKRKP